jgi:tetratricopeptide (TPR) repeat protein
MTLRSSRLRDLEKPSRSVNDRAELCCEVAREFENKGDYENARKALSSFWRRIGERPKLEGLEASTAGEVLLRVGVLTGAIGSKNQIADAQEKAKDLISESLTIFQSTNYRKKIAEAQTELALVYWRTGEYDNAADILKLALAQLTTDSELKAKAVVRVSIVEHSAGRNQKALRTLTNHAPLFEKLHNHTLKGSYHVTLGNRLENLWESGSHPDYLDRALIEYAAASYHFEKAEHRCYLAH